MEEPVEQRNEPRGLRKVVNAFREVMYGMASHDMARSAVRISSSSSVSASQPTTQ